MFLQNITDFFVYYQASFTLLGGFILFWYGATVPKVQPDEHLVPQERTKPQEYAETLGTLRSTVEAYVGAYYLDGDFTAFWVVLGCLTLVAISKTLVKFCVVLPMKLAVRLIGRLVRRKRRDPKERAEKEAPKTRRKTFNSYGDGPSTESSEQVQSPRRQDAGDVSAQTNDQQLALPAYVPVCSSTARGEEGKRSAREQLDLRLNLHQDDDTSESMRRLLHAFAEAAKTTDRIISKRCLENGDSCDTFFTPDEPMSEAKKLLLRFYELMEAKNGERVTKQELSDLLNQSVVDDKIRLAFENVYLQQKKAKLLSDSRNSDDMAVEREIEKLEIARSMLRMYTKHNAVSSSRIYQLQRLNRDMGEKINLVLTLIEDEHAAIEHDA